MRDGVGSDIRCACAHNELIADLDIFHYATVGIKDGGRQARVLEGFVKEGTLDLVEALVYVHDRACMGVAEQVMKFSI